MKSTSRHLLLVVALFVLWSSYKLLTSPEHYKTLKTFRAFSEQSADPPMATNVPIKLLTRTVAARARHTATIIFIHGLGDTMDGWRPVATMFGSIAEFQHIKWVLPQAPTIPVTANGGMRMPSWFDIEDFTFATEDEPGMRKTVLSLNELITAEIDAGIPAERIVIGGFSQGGAMSLLTGLTTERKLAGVVVMSGWLPLKNKFKAMTTDHAQKLPIFWGHGEVDPLVRFIWAQASVRFLKEEIGVRTATEDNPVGVDFNSYPDLQHSADEEELGHLQSWLKKVLPAKSES